MYFIHESKPKKKWGLIIAIAIVLSILLGIFVTFAVFKVMQPERVPGKIIQKTAVQYNVSDDAVVTIAQNNLPSVVVIETRGGSEVYSGSGFIVGYVEDTTHNATYPIIMTNYHVISAAAEKNGYKIFIKLFDKADFFKSNAEIIGFDSKIDIAVLKLKVDLQDVEQRVVEFGNSRGLHYGQRVVAIGNALGGGLSVTAGEISIPEVIQEITLDNSNANQTIQHLIQTSAAINSGNSGGVLLDMLDNGRVIGINTYKLIADTKGDVNIPADNVGLAVPSNMAKAILDYIKSSSNNFKNYIGEVSTDRTWGLNLYNLEAGLDSENNNIIRTAQEIKFGQKVIAKGKTITKINGIEISSLHKGMYVPSPSIFTELELYYGSNADSGLQENKFYNLNLTIDGEDFKIPNLYLQREISWMNEFLK